MTSYVIDASVAIKWFVPELLTEEALGFLHDEHTLLAPDLLWPEVGNIVWKKVRRGELVREDAEVILTLCHQVPFQIVDSQSLIDSALEIALEFDRSVYDATYLALAVHQDCPMLTADLRLANALGSTAMSRYVTYIGAGPD